MRFSSLPRVWFEYLSGFHLGSMEPGRFSSGDLRVCQDLAVPDDDAWKNMGGGGEANDWGHAKQQRSIFACHLL